MTREEVIIDIRDNMKPIVGDCISRQAVLDLIADYDLSMGQVVRGIHALPSVTPQEPILDKLRAEIDQYLEIEGFGSEYRNDVKGIIDKYKAEKE